MKQILLGKNHDITDFASKDASRYVLQSVHYKADSQCVEACDGKVLIRVPVVQVEGEFPPVKTAGEKEPIDCLIPLAPFKKALGNIPKVNLPVLGYCKLDSNGAVSLTTTDLETEQAVTCRPVEGNYPNCDQVMATAEPKLTIAIAAGILKRVAEYALKHATDGDQTITLKFTDAASAVAFSIHIQDMDTKTKATGVLMPVRVS